MNQAVHNISVQKESEIRGLKDTIVRSQREGMDTKRKLAAAEELITDFTVKVKEVQEGITESDQFQTLATRYGAATDLLESALERLPEIGELRRRCEALEGLLQAGIDKFREEYIEGAIEEALVRMPSRLHEHAKPLLESAVSVEQVGEIFKSLMGVTGSRGVTEHEPLPRGGSQRRPIEENRQPKKRQTMQAKLTHRLRNAVHG